MDFEKLKELLADNAEALQFVVSVDSQLTESKAKIALLADESDKYKSEAKEAFNKRDELKNELESLKTNSNKKGDNSVEVEQLTAEIERLKGVESSLKNEILTNEKKGVLGSLLDGVQFRGETKEARQMVKEMLSGKLSDGLIKDDRLGWVYADANGNPIRNPDDMSQFLTPDSKFKSNDFKLILDGFTVKSDGSDLPNGSSSGDFKGDKPSSYKEMLGALVG